ncbi:thiamine-binding protein [Kineococcus sp. SYSU DK003]|uniref:thiamine-binding protein n=1 Tax=Kineococcus sp. SYSU DK003 TaxID=3383124 RepID=UPI003D7CE00A
MIVAFSVAPSGGPAPADGQPDSVSAAVADAVLVVRSSGLPHRTDSMFTTIEGEWQECMEVVRRACEAVGRHGPRVSLVLKADIRPGRTGEMTGKLERLEAAVERAQGEAGRGQ